MEHMGQNKGSSMLMVGCSNEHLDLKFLLLLLLLLTILKNLITLLFKSNKTKLGPLKYILGPLKKLGTTIS